MSIDLSGEQIDNCPNVAKAWVDFTSSGTVTINSDHNVDSIFDLGTGQYLINFTIAFSSNQYAVSVCGSEGSSRDITTAQSSSSWTDNNYAYSPSVGSVYINTSNGSAFGDHGFTSVICFREQ